MPAPHRPWLLFCCLTLCSLPVHAGFLADRLHERLAARRSSQPTTQPTQQFQILHDIAYGTDRRETLDVYLPPPPQTSSSRTASVIFMVHGGAWKIGDKAHVPVVQNKVAHWLPQGYVFISVNYPMLPEASPRQQADAVARALAYAQAHAGEWQADPARFILMGHSAGAHLIALINAQPSLARRQGARPWLGAIALDSAAMDVPAIMAQPHFSFYDEAFGTDPRNWPLLSPRQQLNREARPLLMVCSTRRQNSCSQADAMAATARSLHVTAQVLRQDLSHQDINEQLGMSNSYTAKVDDFLRQLGLEDF